MLFGDIMSGVTAGLSIIQGIGGYKTSGEIADINRNIAKMQYDYNRKEIDRAFNINLKSVLREQASERLGAIKEAESVISNINLNTGNNKNVDNESFEYDIKDKTKKEIADNMLFLLDNQSIARNELLNTKVAQGYNLDLNYLGALSNINNQLNQQREKYMAQILSGSVKLGNSISNYNQYKVQQPMEEKE